MLILHETMRLKSTKKSTENFMSAAINVVCYKWKTLANGESPLMARHSFASVLKKSGVNIALISEALGHSDLATTQIYLDSFDNEQVDEAMKNLL